jgi:hypothetical protein
MPVPWAATIRYKPGALVAVSALIAGLLVHGALACAISYPLSTASNISMPVAR